MRVEPDGPALLHYWIYRVTATVLRSVSGRGTGRAAWVLEKLFGSHHAAVFSVFGNRLLRVPLGDGYWMPALTLRGDYEPEIQFILGRTMNSECAFLDCGANIGWWSVFASTIISSPKKIVAVEASPPLYTRLTDTARLNGDSFMCLNRAIWDVTGERVAVLGNEWNHARSSVTTLTQPHDTVTKQSEVVSITLDDIGKELLDTPISGVVVKLDVEGAEVRALMGGRSLLKGNCLVVYEDHGADARSAVTRDVLAFGFQVFHCDDSLRVHEIPDAETLAPFKRDPRRGYNLIACRPGTAFHRVMLELLS